MFKKIALAAVLALCLCAPALADTDDWLFADAFLGSEWSSTWYDTGDLGDERVPVAVLGGGAALTLAGAIIVHKKRRSAK